MKYINHASEEQKLRQVVNKWMLQRNFNSVLGFSGTPNMKPALNIPIYGDLSVKCSQFANVVTYYPLIKAIGNFLKVPTVRYADMNSSNIISKGIKEFFVQYKDTVYGNGTTAKIAIYAPSISVLEEDVYPEVCSICSEIGIDPSSAILKYHKGNNEYSVSEDAQYEFSMLDSPLSKIRIVLLVGIGREGWNCRSLTGVILSQRNACPQNMVLQISCRCLREVDNAKTETALIWLNKSNADTLNKQLAEQQYTNLREFGSQHALDRIEIYRYPRMDKLKLPPVDFYQLRINYDSIEYVEDIDVKSFLEAYQAPYLDEGIIYTQDFKDQISSESASNYDNGSITTFRSWIDTIVKESFGTISLDGLKAYFMPLHKIYSQITEIKEMAECFNPKVNQGKVRSDIRTCFVPKREFKVNEELVPEEASLLKIEALKSPVEVSSNAILSPSQEKVKEIIASDSNPKKTSISDDELKVLLGLKERGITVEIPDLSNNDVYDRTYHYLPYRCDSSLEDNYLQNIINHLQTVPNVEFYFNGDESLTDFKIRCYRKNGTKWKFIGHYYPDFVMLTRDGDNSINKIIIIETKGEGFAGKFEPRKKFMEDVFIKINNEKYGREKFAFLYLEDTEAPDVRLQKTVNKINSFLLN